MDVKKSKAHATPGEESAWIQKNPPERKASVFWQDIRSRFGPAPFRRPKAHPPSRTEPGELEEAIELSADPNRRARAR